MRRLTMAWLLIAQAGSLACTIPTYPSAAPIGYPAAAISARPPVPDPTPVPPVSVLEVRSFTAALAPYQGGFGYNVGLQLAETSGLSGATIHNLTIVVDTGAEDSMCEWRLVRLAPQTTWDITSMGYCAPGTTSSTPGSRVTLALTYSDDEGHVARFEASTAVSP